MAETSEYFVKHGTKILNKRAATVRALQKQEIEPVIHGTQVWSSTYVLMDYLMRFPPPVGETLLDVGCGWGAMSAFAAKTLAMDVIAVDADQNVLPYAGLHARFNQVQIDFRCRDFDALSRDELKGIHTLVGVDVCFWDRLQPPVFHLIRRALKAGVEQIIIADPGRGPFHDLAARCETLLNGRLEEHTCSFPVEDSAELLIIEKDLLPY